MREKLALRAKELFTGNLALWWATGTGKSGAALKCCTVFDSPSILIVVEKLIHVENWKKEIKERGHSFEPEFTHYNSLGKVKKDWDVIIYDEADVLVTDKRLGDAQTLNGRIIFLSANIPREKLKLLKYAFKFKEDTLTIRDAIKEGLVPKPVFKLYPITLSYNRETCIFRKGKNKAKKTLRVPFKERFKKGVNLEIMCSEVQYYQLLIEEYKFFRSLAEAARFQGFAQVMMLRKGLDIKQWLDSLKTNEIKRLFGLKGRKLVFVNSIEEAEEYGNAVHSKNKASHNQEIVDAFNDHRLDYIVNIGVLVRGMNLVDIEHSIIGTYAGDGIQLEQMIGRSLRYCLPCLHIPYIKNTRDEDKLFKLLNQL